MPFIRGVLLLLLVSLLVSGPLAAQTPPVALHPLDPLTAAELEVAAAVVSGAPQFPVGANFATLVLKEPAKSDVLAFTEGAPIARQAFAVVLDRPRNRVFEAVVDVTASRMISWSEVKGVQPAVLESEYDVFARVVKSDPAWQAAM